MLISCGRCIVRPLLRESRLRVRWLMASSFFTVQPGATDQPTGSTVSEYTLEGAPIQAGKLTELNVRGRTLKSRLHPLQPQGQAWISEKHINARAQSSFIVRPAGKNIDLTLAGREHSAAS